ncbi:MAG: beta-glucosidase BglX [Lewinellaceae bacterium]|nr:beta-glucosidase BglX [Lewinellaceae bacterium]
MKWNLSIIAIGIAMTLWIVPQACGQTFTPMATDARIEKKIDSLLRLMTLEEKIGQMNQYNGSWDVTGPAPQSGGDAIKYQQIRKGEVGAMLNVLGVKNTREIQQLAVNNSRLGIPLLFGYDVIHGYQTMMPIPLGETASWDMQVLEKSARVAAVEATAAGVNWTFAPMMDVSRDARWGRVMEGAGEDPYLGAQAAVARVRGFQGPDLSLANTLAACAKHFAAYGFGEAAREYNTVEITENTLQNVVLPPFKAAAEAGVATFMNAFNEIGGVPATASTYLQRDLLKGAWGFQGFVVSDWGSIRELITHGVAADKREASRLAALGGSDMDMESSAYTTTLAQLVRDGNVPMAYVDDAARRILRVKFLLGLFDDPYRYCDEAREKQYVGAPEHVAIAREVGRKSIVLLKNEGQLLPLAKNAGSIAVIGALAADKDVPLGSWRGQAVTGSAVSLLEGIQAAVAPGVKVVYEPGYKLTTGLRSFVQDLTFAQDDGSGFKAAIKAAKNAEIVVMAIGEDCWQSGEARSQVDITLKGRQEELLREILKVNKRVVVVLMNGRPLAIPGVAEVSPAILEAWHLGSQAGNSIADVLFGDYNPAGKLPISFPRATGQAPIYYNRKSTGRPVNSENNVFWSHYTDAPNTPLYPFGYGLSYTNFQYSELKLSASEIYPSETLQVQVTLTNTGSRAGEEVAQLYVRDLVGSVTRPVKELKGFQKVLLRPGESRQLTFSLTTKDLAFFTGNREWAAEPGDFEVFVGGNSEETLKGAFKLN